jgi:hypothetical protein
MRPGWLFRGEGAVPYGPANEAMHRLAERRLVGEIPDTVILLEFSGKGTRLKDLAGDHDGKILNANFKDYRLPRFSDTPQVEMVSLGKSPEGRDLWLVIGDRHDGIEWVGMDALIAGRLRRAGC